MTAVLRHNRYPLMRIVNPTTGKVHQFSAISTDPPLGVLVVNEDEPEFADIMAVAQKDPGISIELSGILRCECGEQFAGTMAKANLAKHQKATEHTGSETLGSVAKVEQKWTCPVDGTVFRSENDLILHTRDVHAPEGPKDEQPDEPQGAVFHGTVTTGIPAATRTGG